MTEEEKKEYLNKQERIKKEKEEAAEKQKLFHNELKQTSLKTFKDRPEEVKSLRQVRVEANLIGLEWDAPGSNNSPITGYNVYISDFSFNSKLDTQNFGKKQQKEESLKKSFRLAELGVNINDTYFEIKNLSLNTFYYVMVAALNEVGEGYRPQ